jgi:hypothetical protein
MPKFSVSLWATFEADNWADAQEKADKITDEVALNNEVYVSDSGIIDVECSDEEYCEEGLEDDLLYENIDKG